MSRYILNPPGWDRVIEFAVGWDPALETYFGQVMDRRDDGTAIVWGGALPPHFTDVDAMMRAVNAGIAGIRHIPGVAVPLPPLKLSSRVRERLIKDRDNHFRATGQRSWPGKQTPVLALDLFRQPSPPPPPPRFDEDGNRITDEVDFEWDEDDDQDDEPSGPSLAFPPLYVLRTVARCPQCRTAMHVYMLGCAAYCDAEDGGDPIEDFHFLRQTESVPDEVLDLLKRKCPGFRFAREKRGGRRYLMNHCRCKARLDDDYLHGDVGAAFWPDTPEGYGHFDLFLLPIDEPIPMESSYMLGGGEYLDYENAKPFDDL